MSNNKETEINSRNKFVNTMNTFEPLRDIIDAKNLKIQSKSLQKELAEHDENNSLSFTNVCFNPLLEKELAGFADKHSNKVPSTHFEKKKLNLSVENTYSKSIIPSNNIPKINWTLPKENRHSDLQPSCSYNKNDQSLSSNIDHEKDCIDCISNVFTLPLSNHLCSTLHYNLCENLSTLIELENSRSTDQYLLLSRTNICTSPESNITIEELNNPILKRQSYMNHNLYRDNKKFCNQLSLKVEKSESEIIKEHLQNSNFDSGAKYIPKIRIENVLSSTNELLVYPNINIDIKDLPRNSISQINNLSYHLFDKSNSKQLVYSIIKHSFSNITEFFHIQPDTIPNNSCSSSKCNQVKDFILAKDVSKLLFTNGGQVNLQKVLCNSFNPNNLSNTKTNSKLVETICTMSLFNQLGKQFSHEESAKKVELQTFIKHKLLPRDTMKANSTTRKENSPDSSSLIREIAVKSAPLNFVKAIQSKTNNPLVASNSLQLQSCCKDTNIFQNHVAINKKFSDQTFNLKYSADIRPFSQILKPDLIINNCCPRNFSLNSFITDMNSDCTMQSYNCCIGNQIRVQICSLLETVENKLEAKLLFKSRSNFSCQPFPFLKIVDKFDDDSFFQSKVNDNTIYNSSKDKTNNDINRRLTTKQMFNALSNSSTNKKSSPCKQFKVQFYPANAQSSHLVEGESKHLSSQKASETPLTYTVDLSQESLSKNDLTIKEVSACLSQTQYTLFENVELSNVFKCNNLLKLESSTPLSSDELSISITPYVDKITTEKTNQFENETLDAEGFDADIDKAIEESMNKYESFMCNKGVLATPETSNKSSQTDKVIVKERQPLCKRCLIFDDENFVPSKRLKSRSKNNIDSNFSFCAQVGARSSTEPMAYGIKCDSSSNLPCINVLNGSNKCNSLSDDFIRTNNSVLQSTSKASSLTINQALKNNVNMDMLFCENSNVNDELSLYDEDMDIGDGLSWSKDNKEMFESESVLYDHRVPVVEEVAEKPTLLKSPSSFLYCRKKPILKIGLSRSARLKPLHQK